MNTDQQQEHQSGERQQTSFWRTPTGTVTAVFLGAAGLLLLFEHRAHIFGDWVLFLPLLLCIGMHFLMHGSHGHGHGGHGSRHPEDDDDAR